MSALPQKPEVAPQLAAKAATAVGGRLAAAVVAVHRIHRMAASAVVTTHVRCQTQSGCPSLGGGQVEAARRCSRRRCRLASNRLAPYHQGCIRRRSSQQTVARRCR
jgi:hypothetical protein